MEPLRANSIRNLSYTPKDGLFLHGDFIDELREHYVAAYHADDRRLAFEILKLIVGLQFPRTLGDC